MRSGKLCIDVSQRLRVEERVGAATASAAELEAHRRNIYVTCTNTRVTIERECRVDDFHTRLFRPSLRHRVRIVSRKTRSISTITSGTAITFAPVVSTRGG